MITPTDIQQVLGNSSITFAQIDYTTKPQLSAKNKAEDIQKHTVANVILCSNINAQTSVYANRVKRTARLIAGNNQQAVEAFTPSDNYFEHTDCYSVVEHKQHKGKFYLYAIYNTAKSYYTHNGVRVSKEYVAEYMTPSGARELLDPKLTVTHVGTGVEHTVRVRTIALSSINTIRARRQLIVR